MDSKREKEEQEFIDELFPAIYKKIEQVREEIEKIQKTGNKTEFQNAAILLNNKIVELGQEFKSKDIGFYSESSLRSVILAKLITQYKLAYEQLKIAVEINNDMDEHYLESSYDSYKSMFDDTVENYNAYCNEIYDYSIEENIVDDIAEKYSEYKDRELAKKKVLEYKKELEKLGYAHLTKETLDDLCKSSEFEGTQKDKRFDSER